MRLFTHVLPLALTLLLPYAAWAQAPDDDDDRGLGLRFNGMGRTFLQQSDLGGTLTDTDTTTNQNNTDGEFVLDLALNAQPNENTEVQGIIRLRNEFGGFFGAGVNVEVRELWARGVVADVVRYRVGDMDVALTPYTLWLPEEDGVVNEPALFAPLREIIDYEEFYTDNNTRRLQGAQVGFGLEFEEGLEALDAETFIARLRGTDFTNTPTRLIAGGRLAQRTVPLTSAGTRVNLGQTLSYTWDDLQSGNATTGIRNLALSVDFDIAVVDNDRFGLHVLGETGISSVSRGARVEEPDEISGVDTTFVSVFDPFFEEDDAFVEVGLRARLKPQRIAATAQFVNVGPDFYSASAQSKRIDYTRAVSAYNRLGQDRRPRPVSLYDLNRDQGLYTFRIADQLMAYDPRFSNALPFGQATPNRRGARLGVTYGDTEHPLDAMIDVALLNEIRGQGTQQLRQFRHVRAASDIRFGQLIGWDQDLTLTLGTQFENTTRDGGPLEEVDFTTLLFEAGLAVEVYTRLDVLFGAKLRTADGNEFLPEFTSVDEGVNDVFNFNDATTAVNDEERILGAGLRYRFSDDAYLTVQYQHLSYTDTSDPVRDAEDPTTILAEPLPEYGLGQFFILYSVRF